jgi:hypothetical protein
MAYRIYADESGTHEGSPWLLIGMLFVPQHAQLHRALCEAKDSENYFNKNPRRKAKYRCLHFVDISTARDVRVGKKWIDAFLLLPSHFRCLAFDWSMWHGKYFGDAFEPDTLKKRRAYKKWCELLLQPELADPLDGGPIRGAELFLDRLRIAYQYDVLDHLKERFTPTEYRGRKPYLAKLQHAASWRDANQCLQLADLLLGCVKHELMPSRSKEQAKLHQYLVEKLKPLGIAHLGPGFWKQYHPKTLREHMPKFSVWFWQPERKRH